MKSPFLINDDGRECSKCQEFKSWSEFYKGGGPRGKQSHCKNCRRAYRGDSPRIYYKRDDNGRECTKCRIFKPWSEFFKNKTGTNGHMSYCKKCCHEIIGSEWKVEFVIDDDGRECSRCNEYKSWSEYYNSKVSSTGKSSSCIDCDRKAKGYQKRKEFESDDNGRVCTTCERYLSWFNFSKHKGGLNGYSSECKFCFRHRRVKYRYGITSKEYRDMIDAQDNSCAICGKKETREINGITISLPVDHDHNTGKVRGLLCSNCNTGIGYFKDSPELLVKAAEYLKGYQEIDE